MEVIYIVGLRADKSGTHRTAFDKNKKVILKTQTVCGICGNVVDKKLKYPHPLSPVIDHIVPVAKNGHPSDINNLQLAHWQCNRQKSDKLFKNKSFEEKEIQVVGNRNLPHTIKWVDYRA
ncbi:HNH endonuclease [Carnobacteriaceae bacterium zg-ZUI78]|nr:HNH endonuclease [Carnobacteriaceae bacterium zg-ZUI78]